MKTSRYFTEVVLRKRPYIQLEWCEEALVNYSRMEVQNDGRIRYWIYIKEQEKYLRVVFLEDGETLHNAFWDRDYEELDI